MNISIWGYRETYHIYITELPAGGTRHHHHVPGLGQRGGHVSGFGAVQGRDGGPLGGLHRSAACPLHYEHVDSHIEAEIAAFAPGCSSANVTEVMLLDHP